MSALENAADREETPDAFPYDAKSLADCQDRGRAGWVFSEVVVPVPHRVPVRPAGEFWPSHDAPARGE